MLAAARRQPSLSGGSRRWQQVLGVALCAVPVIEVTCHEGDTIGRNSSTQNHLLSVVRANAYLSTILVPSQGSQVVKL